MGTALSTPTRTTHDAPQQDDTQVVRMTSVDSFSSAPAPTTVQWEQQNGGHVVFVTGAWDNWRSKTPLTRANPADPFVAVLSMPVGIHQYKYIVDGNWMHNPSAPTQTDQHGNLNNIVEVKAHKPEFDDDEDVNDQGHQQSFSPPSSFDYSVISQDDVRGEPPEVPIFLGVPLPSGERKSAPTSYVRFNHLYSSRLVFRHAPAHIPPPTEGYRTMAHTSRYKSKSTEKTITTVMVFAV